MFSMRNRTRRPTSAVNFSRASGSRHADDFVFDRDDQLARNLLTDLTDISAKCVDRAEQLLGRFVDLLALRHQLESPRSSFALREAQPNLERLQVFADH